MFDEENEFNEWGSCSNNQGSCSNSRPDYREILCAIVRILSDIKECTCEEIERLLKMIICKLDNIEPDRECCRMITRLLNRLSDQIQEVGTDTGNISENTSNLLDSCNNIIGRLDILIEEAGSTECCDNVIARLDRIINQMDSGQCCNEVLARLDAIVLELEDDQCCDAIIERLDLIIAEMDSNECCQDIVNRLDTIILEMQDDTCCTEINNNLSSILRDLAVIIAEMQDDTCCTEINNNLSSILADLAVIIAEMQDDTCCTEIISTLTMILSDLRLCCEETNNNLSNIIDNLLIIIELIGGGTGGCCICDSDNTFFNNTVSESGSFSIGTGESRRITAITAVFDSTLTTSQNATSMNIQIGTAGTTFTPVYSQCIPGTFVNGQIGSLTIAFTHPILVEGPVEVRFTLACLGRPGNAFVSINVASCPILIP